MLVAALLVAAPAALAASPVHTTTPTTAVIAKVLTPTVAYTAPGGGQRRMGLGVTTPYSRGPQQLLVVDRTEVRGEQWVAVLLPRRPNGVRGWVRADDLGTFTSPWRIRVSRAARTVTVLRAGRRVKASRAVVGKASTPTPAGLFAVREFVAQPGDGGFYGPWVMTLTAHSDVLESFAGGPGQVALHGRGGASLADPLGSAASHGCVRLPNGFVSWLVAHVPVGTPVDIR